jgi:hypothetical protein
MTAPAQNGRAERFDLDAAAKAAAAESKPVPFPFSYKGGKYEMPPPPTWPLEAQRLIGEGELAPALAMLVGEEQYGKLLDAGMTVGDLMLLMEAVGKDAGVGGLPNLPEPARRGSTRT